MAKTSLPRLILASSSPYRRQQLAGLGLPFTAVTPRFDEDHTSDFGPAKLAAQLARGNALCPAADGKLYPSGEDGDIFVVAAGPEYNEIAKNNMGELVMASPAISDGTLYIRAQHHLFAISQSEQP